MYVNFCIKAYLLVFQVVNEALRVYPLTFVERLCVKDYKVPGTNFVVPKGMLVQIARYCSSCKTRVRTPSWWSYKCQDEDGGGGGPGGINKKLGKLH